jgi:hypothetical protein
MSSNDRIGSSRSRRAEYVSSPTAWCRVSTDHSMITRLGSRTATGRRSTAWTMLNIAVQAPMPTARIVVAAAAKPGSRPSRRAP